MGLWNNDDGNSWKKRIIDWGAIGRARWSGVRRRNVAFRGRGAHRNERKDNGRAASNSGRSPSGDGAAEKNSSAKWKSALSWLKHSRASYLIEKYRSRLEPRMPFGAKSKEIRTIQAQSAPRFDQNQHCVPLGRLFWAAVYQQRTKHDSNGQKFN